MFTCSELAPGMPLWQPPGMAIWNQLTDRDQEAIRRVATIEREFPDLLVSQGWEPYTPTIQNGSVFASKCVFLSKK